MLFMKTLLIAISLFASFDAAVCHGEWRMRLVHEAGVVANAIVDQDWTSGPLI
jgi:hypothetical protein